VETFVVDPDSRHILQVMLFFAILCTTEVSVERSYEIYAGLTKIDQALPKIRLVARGRCTGLSSYT